MESGPCISVFIYLYDENEREVSVKLDFEGDTCTYPSYEGKRRMDGKNFCGWYID